MASILAIDSPTGGDLQTGVFATVCATLGHTVTYINTNDAFATQSLSGFNFIVRSEVAIAQATRAFDPSNPVQLAKLTEWVNAGGIFINIDNDDPTIDGVSWFLCGGVTRATYGSQTTLNITSPNTIFSTFVAADCDGGANELYEWGRYTATGGLSTALTDVTNGSAVMLYGVQGDGRTIYMHAGANNTPHTGTAWSHWFTDVLNWASAGGPVGGGNAGTATGTPGVAGADETGFFCPAEGSVVESTGHSQFGAALALDLEAGKAYRWTNLPFTCGLTVPQTCAASFEKPDGLYFGTRNSRVAIFGRENVYSDGPWQNMVSTDSNRLTVTAGAAGTVTVSETLSTYGDRLAGMTCTLIKNYGTSSETRQERTILTNSATVILVSWALTGEGQDWTSNPASGDVLIIGLIRPYIEPMEIHTADASYPGSLRADYNLESSSVTSATIAIHRQVYTASGRRKSVGTSRATAAASRFSTLDEIDNEPEGMGIVPAAGFKAHIERITWDQPPCELVFRQLEKDVVK